MNHLYCRQYVGRSSLRLLYARPSKSKSTRIVINCNDETLSSANEAARSITQERKFSEMDDENEQTMDEHLSVTGNSTERGVDKKVPAGHVNVELPPGFQDENLFSYYSGLAESNLMVTKTSKLTALGVAEGTNPHVVVHHFDEALSKAEAHQTMGHQSTPKRKSTEGHEITSARPEYLSKLTPIAAVSRSLSNPFSKVRLSASYLPIPHASDTTDDEDSSEKVATSLIKTKRQRPPIVARLERQSNETGGRPPLSSKKRQLQLPTSSNRIIANRKLDLESSETECDTIPDIPKEPDALKEDTTEGPALQIIQSYTNVVYCWDALKLGEELGSAALNDFFASANEGITVPKLNARQVLQIISSMRVKTVLPPPQSKLHKVVHKARLIQEDYTALDHDISLKSTSPMVPYEKLEKVYETMCLQDIDDGSANRREVQYMNIDSLMEKFRSFENHACDLKMREEEVMAMAKQLGGGLIDKNLVYRTMGYRDAQENMNHAEVHPADSKTGILAASI